MENASKALLMAGGILIAIITIALLVRSFSTIGIFQKAQLSEEEQAQLVAFNEQYTKYLNEYMYGTEVITVINKSLNNREYPIAVKIKFTNGYTYNGYKEYFVTDPITGKEYKRWKEAEIQIKKGDTLIIENDAEGYSTLKNKINYLTESGEINTMAFKCTNVEYDSYGRVNSIKFEEKKWGNLYEDE